MAKVALMLSSTLLLAASLLHTSMAVNNTANIESYTSPFINALTPLYQMTDGFIRVIFPNSLDSRVVEDLISVINGTNTNYQKTAQNILAKYAGFSACLIIGVIFFIVMPWIGLFCCCCRLCGNCGGKNLEEDSKHAKCKRWVGSFSLLAFTLVMLGGMIMVFFSGSAIYDLIGKQQLSGDLSRTSNGLISSVDTTFGDVRKAIDYWTQTNALDDKIDEFFNDAGTRVTDSILDIAAQSNVTERALTLLNAVADFNNTVNSLADGLQRHRAIIERTMDNLTSVITDLTNLPTIPNDHTPIIELLQVTVAALQKYDFAPVINETQDARKRFTGIPNIDKVYNEAVGKIVESVSRSLNDSKGSITDQLPDVTSVVNPLLDQADATLKSVLDSVTPAVDNVITALNSDTAKTISYYVFIGACVLGSTVGVVVLLLLIGISCGFGERASPDAGGCNRGRGADCLLAAVGFMFIFFSGLMLLLIILFVSGSLITSQGCYSFENPEALAQTIQQFPELPVAVFQGIEAYSGCLKNKSLGVSFNSLLSPYRADIDSAIEDELSNLDIESVFGGLDFDLNQFDILPADLNQSLIELTQLNTAIPSYSTVISAVRYNPIVNSSSPLAIARSQMEVAVNSDTRMRGPLDDVTFIQSYFGSQLSDSGAVVESELEAFTQHNATQVAAGRLLVAILAAKEKINNDQADVKNQTFIELYNMATAIIVEVGQEALDTALDVQCLDISTNFQAAVNIGCVTILEPYNGLWFSLGWSLSMFIPCICIALCLVRLFRSEFSYNGKDGDHEFKYGNGGFRDDYGNAMAGSGGDFTPYRY